MPSQANTYPREPPPPCLLTSGVTTEKLLTFVKISGINTTYSQVYSSSPKFYYAETDSFGMIKNYSGN